ncbi:MAG: acyl carrier protein, partial [Proteobacteria bacterium]|nr:acyl carrier protein [Pseudomonadota bacterium]
RLQRLPPAERRNLLIRVLSDLVAEVLRLPRDEVAPRERLFDLGIDSLIAIELKNRLQGILGLGLSTTLLFDYPTIETLAQYLLETLTPVLSAVADGASAPGSASAAAIPAVRELSEEEAEAMLLAQLEQLEGGPR